MLGYAYCIRYLMHPGVFASYFLLCQEPLTNPEQATAGAVLPRNVRNVTPCNVTLRYTLVLVPVPVPFP